MVDEPQNQLESALEIASAAIIKLGSDISHDATIRARYNSLIARAAEEIREAHRMGRLTLEQALAQANQLRNEQVRLMREGLSRLGAGYSEVLKPGSKLPTGRLGTALGSAICPWLIEAPPSLSEWHQAH